MPMRPARYREGSTGSKASDASGSSTQSGGPEWTHYRELCAVYHAENCQICDDWIVHCAPLWASPVVNEFRLACDEALEMQRVSYAQESEDLNREIEVLTRELKEVEDELKRVQKGPEFEDNDEQSRLRIQVVETIQ